MWANLVEMGIQPSEIGQVSWRQYLILMIAKAEIEEASRPDDGVVKVNSLDELVAVRGGR